MRLTIYIFFIFTWVLALPIASSAQCGSCTPDATCYQPGGTQCPLSGQAPPMYLNNPYSTVVTFDMPPDTNVSPVGVVNIINVQYASISGLPIGITWTCNSPSNGCQYNPSAGQTKACITFCGTPLSPPGNYTATINIYGTASTPIGNQTQYQPLQYTFTILPDSSSNGYFSYTPSSGCDSITVNYAATFSMPLPNTVSYDWNLGNGNTYSGATPPPQVYNTAATYYPTLTTHVNKLVVKKVSTTVSGNWWCGDFEEPNYPIVGCTGQPDVYFILQNGSSNYISSTVNNNTTSIWDNLNITLQSALFSISLWDDDDASQDDNGGSAAIAVTGPGQYNFSTVSPFGGGGFGTIEVIEQLDYDIITTDTVVVNASPPVVNITAIPSDTVCEKAPVTLSVYPGNYTYTWYKNGNVMSDTLGNSITVLNQSATYTVKLVDNVTGCTSWMNPAHVYFKPGVYNMYITYNGTLTLNPPTGFNYQWMYNGIPIFPGGNTGYYVPTMVGLYSCIVSNDFGCSDTAFYQVNSLAGIGEYGDISSQLNLFPNPAIEQITLTYGPATECSADIRIVNNVGAVVKTQRVNCTSGGNAFEVSIADLANGMYYLEFKTASGFAVKRFLKQ